ncbi:MAG: recombinase family protein [Actinomycetota bacterium]|nr:recombinase family protein [Actinomycetota bacterium]
MFAAHSRVCGSATAVPTHDQHPEAQYDGGLTAAGCEQIFVDHASANSPQTRAREALPAAGRAGDQLVITRLDRLGRSLEHLIDLSGEHQTIGVDLVVLDQGIDTSTAVDRMFFQILGRSPSRTGHSAERTRQC